MEKMCGTGFWEFFDLFLARGFGKGWEGRRSTLSNFGAGAWWLANNLLVGR